MGWHEARYGPSFWRATSTNTLYSDGCPLRYNLLHSVLRAVVPVTIVFGGCVSAPHGLPAPGSQNPTGALVEATPESVGIDARLPTILDSVVSAGLAAGAAPGAALAIGRHGRLVHLTAYGRIDPPIEAPAITDSTRFDLASLTKVVGTTTGAMILEEEGRLELDSPLREYLPELDAPDKAGITVRMLLSHSSGLTPPSGYWRDPQERTAVLRQMNSRPLAYMPGDSTIYIDWGLILTGWIIERVTGDRLDAFLQERVWGPLGMRETGFNPVARSPIPPGSDCTAALPARPSVLAQIAATEIDTVYRHRPIHGIVHDENACAFGGVAGHAGLFSSARDLAVFAQMMLNGGEYDGVAILHPHTIARWTARRNRGSSRALGWDTPHPASSAGRYVSPRSFGHTGFTGTSIWMDPERGIFVILLTNRVNPTRANDKYIPLRRAVADAVQRAILDAPLVEWEDRM